MTPFLIAFIWLIVGIWICWKRNWYKDAYNTGGNEVVCVFAVIGAPINLVITLIRVYCAGQWDNRTK